MLLLLEVAYPSHDLAAHLIDSASQRLLAPVASLLHGTCPVLCLLSPCLSALIGLKKFLHLVFKPLELLSEHFVDLRALGNLPPVVVMLEHSPNSFQLRILRSMAADQVCCAWCSECGRCKGCSRKSCCWRCKGGWRLEGCRRRWWRWWRWRCGGGGLSRPREGCNHAAAQRRC